MDPLAKPIETDFHAKLDSLFFDAVKNVGTLNELDKRVSNHGCLNERRPHHARYDSLTYAKQGQG